MKSEIKNRTALLGVLLIVGIVLAQTGTTLANELENTFLSSIRTEATFLVPESGEILKVADNDAEELDFKFETEAQRALEIAKKDSAVQELLEGKNYQIAALGLVAASKEDTVEAIPNRELTPDVSGPPNSNDIERLEEDDEQITSLVHGIALKGVVELIIDVEGNLYRITLDTDSQEVLDIQEETDVEVTVQ